MDCVWLVGLLCVLVVVLWMCGECYVVVVLL